MSLNNLVNHPKQQTTHKKIEEECEGRLKWVESVTGDLWNKDSSKSEKGEREGYKMVVRPAVMYGLDAAALKKRQ